MVKTCCVKNCDIGSDRNITCFRFPNSRLIKRQWIDAIGLSNKLTANSLICIRHFQEDDYDIVRGRPRLKAKVIPSVFSELDRVEQSQVNDKRHKSHSTKVNKEAINSTYSNSKTVSRGSKNLQNEDSHITLGCKNLENEENEVTDGCKNFQNQHSAVSEGQNEDSEVTECCTSLRNKDKNRINDHKDERIEDSGHLVEDSDAKQNSEANKLNGVLPTSKRRDSQELLIESTPKIQPSNSADDLNKDIEDIIVNYQIKQTRPVHNVEAIENALDDEWQRIEEYRVEDAKDASSEEKKTDPVFIEVSVQGKGDRAGSPRDCLMVLESVQVELDPQTFLTEDGEHPDADCHETVDLDDVDDVPDEKRQDPISLLTSSDEDEVILQEPHIDTVEVSDETDEDDVPLVALLKRSKKRRSKPNYPHEYVCMDCHYTTPSRALYESHAAQHSTILQVCEICDYTTASKTQFSRHKRKHRDDKKFKCHLCEYKARHNMSLIYHLRSHRALSNSKRGFKCDKCGFKSDVKSVVLKHVKLCTTNVKRYSCDKCAYETKRPSDLKRHKDRRHNDETDAEIVM